jgi:hypothetical protein
MPGTKFLCLIMFFSELFWIANSPVESQTGDNSNKLMKIRDEQNRIDFINEMTNVNSTPGTTSRLCQTTDSESGVFQSNTYSLPMAIYAFRTRLANIGG